MRNIKLNIIALIAILIGSVACSNLDESVFVPANEEVSPIYNESFVNGLGEFKAISVTGNQTWEYYSNGYAIISGYVSSVNNENEDWLISPEIDLTTTEKAYFSFDHVARYFANLSSEATVWISENYDTDSLPATAIWTKLTTPAFTDPGSWTFANSGDIILNEFAGKKIRIAFKYISTSTKAGTWEMKNFVVRNGEPAIIYGNDGSEEMPYTISEAMTNQTSAFAWVSGYIVGYVWSGTSTNFTFGADTCSQATNILVADTNNLKSIYLAKTMPVQLPTGIVRTGLNLQTNKDNIGKKVLLYGSLTSYFGVPGLKTVSYYEFEDGTTGGTKPIKAIFAESFANSSQGNFTIQNVVLPAGFTTVWLPTASYGMTASAYKSPTDFASESWLVSPKIDLSNVSTTKMTFDHALNYVANMANKLTYVSVWVSTDYSTGLPSSATWTQLTVPVYPAGNNWTFVSSGEVNLDNYAGNHNVTVAFKYVSIAGDAATWEVKNLVIY